MGIKRIVALGIVSIMSCMLSVMPVSAHGHHHRQADTSSDVICEVCSVEGCDKDGLHVHDGETYCGYAHKGGYCDGSCDAVEVCAVEDCTEKGHHIHDGETYCGYVHESGYCDGSCDAVEVCAVEGCTEKGRHIHDGETYCGYAHGSGYCDHSCEVSSASRNKGRCGYRKHHGR